MRTHFCGDLNKSHVDTKLNYVAGHIDEEIMVALYLLT